MSTRSTLLAFALAPLAVAFAGCSSAGGGPEMGAMAPADFYAQYTGAWELDAASARDVADQLEALDPSQQRGGFRGGGGGGGRRRGGGGFGGGSQIDASAMRIVRDLAREFPVRIAVTVTDSTVFQNLAGPDQLLLTLGGGSTSVELSPGYRMNASARWDGPRLRIERELPGIGRIIDTLEPTDGGARLAVKRNITLGPRSVEVRASYNRPG